MVLFPPFETFKDQQNYIQAHFEELLNDAIDEFNNSSEYHKALEDRFRQLSPFDHDAVKYYLDQLEIRKVHK